jgi:hypothetical protein
VSAYFVKPCTLLCSVKYFIGKSVLDILDLILLRIP